MQLPNSKKKEKGRKKKGKGGASAFNSRDHGVNLAIYISSPTPQKNLPQVYSNAKKKHGQNLADLEDFKNWGVKERKVKTSVTPQETKHLDPQAEFSLSS